ncbi:hypothetical protein AB0J57_11530 [Streptomyces sp. NPDC049837]|uniref:hypothetical protein n=1 Tax=Streptomyces sp. NPDC049837 TaxID=3155277 RepID=UPI003419CE51
MPRAGSRWCRLAAAALVLLGTLLVCGTVAGQGTGHAGHDIGHDVVAAAGASGQTPGCDPLDDEGGLAPAVPPRPGTLCELLPALHHARVATGAWVVDETEPDVRPRRGPPPLVPLSPLDLSILRV